MPLLDRHIAFVEALRAAGMPVSISEDLDAIAALNHLGYADREVLRQSLAATLVKRQVHRVNFDALFDLYFPSRVGSGPPKPASDPDAEAPDPAALTDELRDGIVDAMAGQDAQEQLRLAVEAVDQFGEMPNRGPGLSRWSSYNTMRQLNPDALVLRLARALMEPDTDETPRSEDLAMATAARRVEAWQRIVEGDVRRRIAEEKSPEHVARTTLRPSLDQIAFTHARRADIDEMRRQIYPLARKLATRLAKEQHARRRGPLDFRRTVRASISTGGVPLATYHRPRRPHRNELVVLCDVSGSVANFASFTLLLVYALQEQFSKVRAFTFVDTVHEVTDRFDIGGDPADTLQRLAESARHASWMGRTDYGRSFRTFAEKYPDALTPKTTLLILGDARSNYTDPSLKVLADLTARCRHAWFLNPEHPRQWGVGDSAAPEFASVIAMAECRNLTQLTEFVHDLL